MNANMNAIQCMGMLMTREALDLGMILELVQVLNNSYFQCQRTVTILSEIFDKQKSGKILLAINILEYLIKNANKNFHQAANKQSFQKLLLNLLKRVRGKSSFLKDLRSNSDNWNKIQAKVLYLVQLWYDAFMLEECVYQNIIESYKTLRKENVLFPPRSANEKNLLFVKTESPILENIEDIARQDRQKFGKRLNNMGMDRQVKKIDMMEEEVVQSKKLTRKVDVDDISEKIAIVRSNGCQGRDMVKLVEEIKKDLQYGKVDKNQEKYWKDIKEAAEGVIEEWQNNNAELIRQCEREYHQAKLGKMSYKQQKPQGQIDMRKVNSQKIEIHQAVELPKEQVRQTEQINLLDL